MNHIQYNLSNVPQTGWSPPKNQYAQTRDKFPDITLHKLKFNWPGKLQKLLDSLWTKLLYKIILYYNIIESIITK